MSKLNEYMEMVIKKRSIPGQNRIPKDMVKAIFRAIPGQESFDEKRLEKFNDIMCGRFAIKH